MTSANHAADSNRGAVVGFGAGDEEGGIIDAIVGVKEGR